MAFTLDNFVRSILAVDAAIGDTSLVVALAAPPLRDPPAPSAGAPGILILQDQPTAPTKIEIVTYTGVSIVGTQVTLTGVTRGLEGTSPQAWPAGTQTFSGTTVAVLAQFATAAALAAVAASIPTTPGDIGAATAAQGALAQTAVQPATLGNYVLKSTTVNGKPLTGDISLSAGDVGAATAAQGVLAASAVQPNTSPVFSGIKVAVPADFWTASPAAFLGAAGFVGTNGSFALSLRANGYRNASTSWTSLNQGGNTKGSGIDLMPDGTIRFLGGTPGQFDLPVIAGLDSVGNLALTGSVFATNIGSAAAQSTSYFQKAIAGKALTKITVSSAAPGTLADGELYLQY